MAISKIWSSYKPVSNLNTYVGEQGEIFYDENTGELRISNGVTPGGLPISASVTVTNKVELDDDTIAAITGGDAGTVELGSTSLSALENISIDSGTITIQDGGNAITVDGAVSVDNFPATQTFEDGVTDAFGRFRVSNIATLFDTKQLHDKLPLFYDEVINGGGASSTHSVTDAATTMTVSDNGEYVIRQSKQIMNYQPGES